jgi:hypothetical protein
MTTKFVFSAFTAPMSLAWRGHVDGLALPKSAQSGNLSLNKTIIRWTSAQSVSLSSTRTIERNRSTYDRHHKRSLL